MRKPPRPSTRKDRPVSGPPVFRAARLEEVHIGGSVIARSHSGDESPDINHQPFDRRDGGVGGRQIHQSGSVDSGLDAEVRTLKVLKIAFREVESPLKYFLSNFPICLH